MKLFVSVIIVAIVIGGFAGSGLMDSSFSITGAIVGGVGAAVLLGLLAFLDAQETKREEQDLRNKEEQESIHREKEQKVREAEICRYKEEICKYKAKLKDCKVRLKDYRVRLKEIEKEKLEEINHCRSLLESDGDGYSVQDCQDCGRSVIVYR